MAPTLRDVASTRSSGASTRWRRTTTSDQRTSVLTHMAWVPPEWSRAAGRVMEGLGARVPSRTLILHPDPDAAAPIGSTREIEHELLPGASATSAPRSSQLWLRGATAKVPGERRRVAAAPRPAGVPALARQAAVRQARVRAARRRRRPADRRLRRVAELPAPTGASPRSSTAPSSPTSPGRGRCRGAPASPTCGRGSSRALAARHGPEGGGAPPRRLAALAAREGRDAAPHRCALAAPRSRSTASRSTGPLPAASASDLLSDQLEVYGRDRVYEAAVRAL